MAISRTGSPSGVTLRLVRKKDAAASLSMSVEHFERYVQPSLKIVLSGRLVLIPVTELDRWVREHARAIP